MEGKDKDILDQFKTMSTDDDAIFDDMEELRELKEDTIEDIEPTIEEKEVVNKINEQQPDTVESAPENEMIVYLVIDRPVHGLINYFRECGVNVSNIYTSIVDARNTILMQSEPCRIIVADTGLGKFTTTKIRQELIDMIGICDENNKVTVLYTDSVIKVDTMRELGKNKIGIDWFKYNGTASMVATILQYNEKYIIDGMADEIDKIATDLKGVRGLTSSLEFGEQIVVNGLSPDSLIKNLLESDEGLLPQYEINL